jgi:hypothetical protein
METIDQAKKAAVMNFGKRGSTTRAYDFREEDGMWTVYVCQSRRAAVLNGVPQIGLGLNEADDLAAILNRVAIQQVTSNIANEPWEWTPPRTPRELRGTLDQRPNSAQGH